MEQLKNVFTALIRRQQHFNKPRTSTMVDAIIQLTRKLRIVTLQNFVEYV